MMQGVEDERAGSGMEGLLAVGVVMTEISNISSLMYIS